ncbi:MAG: PD-(D/E)XK nuclease family protein, partial [Clostridia bacterium]|nr:PD-(D/E)XK nuclease family protein [Clostridia bacterium]
DFGIPFFTDEKLSVNMHPVAKTVLSLFNIIKENWSYSAVFDYLRGGYIYTKTEDGVTAISQEDVDLLENYVTLHGIKGKKAWFSEWTSTDETVFDSVIENRFKEETDLEKLNALRVTIITPFSHFLENNGRTAKAIAEAVYNFMCDINLYDGLLLECDAFDKEGRRNEAEQFKQVWNFIIETLDQLVCVSNGGIISREDFADRFFCGISECSISTIPSGIDRVSLGTVTKNSPTRVKALFVMGTLDGLFPKTSNEGAILSDFDREILSDTLKPQGKEIAPNRTDKILLENFKLYRAFTAATEKLFISLPSLDKEGNSVNPAHLISELSEMFDLTIKENITTKPSTAELLASAKHGFYYMLMRLSEFYREKPEKLWRTIFDWYAQNPEYKEKLDILKRAAEYKRIQPSLSREKAAMLYGKNKKYSITALEKFENCPFSYYLERGLCLTEQKDPTIKKSHIGSLLHMAIYEFCRMVEGDAASVSEIHMRWKSLSDEDTQKYTDSVMEKISEKVLPRAGEDKNRIEYLLLRCKATLVNSIATVRKSLASGEYAAVCYEKNFETVIDWKGDSITLTGMIDRIDVMEQIAEKRLNIRIIDYKSGNKTFSVKAICDKVDMQLVLYALAAENMAKSGVIAENSDFTPRVNAILYSKLSEADNTNISASDIENADGDFGKTQKIDGLFILDENEETGEFSRETLCQMDPNLAENTKSEFLNVGFTSKGEITANSKVASRKDFDILTKYIRKAAVDADKAIKSGNIDIKPYRGSSSPCDYCGFKEICMFDEHLDGYRFETKAENVYEFMEKEVD